jgi:hypothetical protein
MARAIIANGGAAVTPSDTGTLKPGTLYIGTGGDIVVKTVDGDTLTFVNIPDGTFFPIQVVQVFSTDTTADDILILY